jgi:mycofactocin precursor
MTSAKPGPSAVAVASDPGAEALEQPTGSDRTEDELVESDLLVEDVSIDGMCGVY